MTTYAQNVGNINRENAAYARIVSGTEDPTEFISKPNHKYWQLRMKMFAEQLAALIPDAAEWDAFFDAIPDAASAQQISYKLEAEINRRQHMSAIRKLQAQLEPFYRGDADKANTEAILWAADGGKMPSFALIIARYEQEIIWREKAAETDVCDCRELPDGREIKCTFCRPNCLTRWWRPRFAHDHIVHDINPK